MTDAPRLGAAMDRPARAPAGQPPSTAAATATATSIAISNAELEEIAERIRARIRRTTADIIETGLDLIQVKAALGHGGFTGWVNRKFGMTLRTAQKYMRVGAWAEGKSELSSHLQPTTIYQLSAPSTPASIQERVIAEIEAGQEVDARKVEEEIWQARFEAKEAKFAAEREAKRSQSPAAVRARKKAREEKERESANYNAELDAAQDRLWTAVDQAVAILLNFDSADVDKLVDVLSSHPFVVPELRQALIRAREQAR